MSVPMKILILGVTKEVEEYERSVIDYLKSKLLHSDSSIELEDIYFYNASKTSLDEVVSIVENSDGKVIFLTDASIGNTKEYESVARELYKRGVKPFILVTHVESAEFDLLEVSMRLTYLTEYFDRRAEWYHNLYKTMFFNYDTKGFLETPDGQEGDVDMFIKGLKEYVNMK